MTFSEKLARIHAEKQTELVLMLSPRIEMMPLPMMREDDPFLPWGRAMIAATRGYLVGYMFDMAAYLALGAAGAVALERTIAYAMAGSDVLTILHAPFASDAYLRATSDNAFNVDGVTVSDARFVATYAAQHGAGLFVMTNTTAKQPGYDPALGTLDVIDNDAAPPLMMTLRVFGDDAAYASRGEDFAEATAARLRSILASTRE
jgi:hypothetical protein